MRFARRRSNLISGVRLTYSPGDWTWLIVARAGREAGTQSLASTAHMLGCRAPSTARRGGNILDNVVDKYRTT